MAIGEKGNLRVWHLLAVVKVFSVKIVCSLVPRPFLERGLGMRLWRITTCGDIMTGCVLLFRTVGWLMRGIHLGDCRLTRNDFPTALHTLQTMWATSHIPRLPSSRLQYTKLCSLIPRPLHLQYWNEATRSCDLTLRTMSAYTGTLQRTQAGHICRLVILQSWRIQCQSIIMFFAGQISGMKPAPAILVLLGT